MHTIGLPATIHLNFACRFSLQLTTAKGKYFSDIGTYLLSLHYGASLESAVWSSFLGNAYLRGTMADFLYNRRAFIMSIRVLLALSWLYHFRNDRKRYFPKYIASSAPWHWYWFPVASDVMSSKWILLQCLNFSALIYNVFPRRMILPLQYKINHR